MAISSHSSSSSSILDTLFYCEEQDHPWSHDHDENDHGHVIIESTLQDFSFMHLPPLNHPDIFWEDELATLFTKEQQQLQTHPSTFSFDQTDPSLLLARKEAVEWILKVKSHFGFTHLTAILSINYLDRFLSSLHFHKDKSWMIHLLAVTCLSLAAKIEETQVPSLLDLQAVEETKYLFEPKNIQKMELLVMSTLEWKMNPVTPISYLEHFVRRFGLKTHSKWDDFIKKCEDLILSLVSDSRFVGYQASVVAAATMLHVIDEVDYSKCVDYQNQLLDMFKTTKENGKEWSEMIMESSHLSSINPKKRKLQDDDDTMNRVKDAHFISSLSSSPSTTSSSSSLSSLSHCHLVEQPIKKMGIVVQQKFAFASLSCKLFVDFASSPR